MQNKLKPYQIICTILALPVCLFLFVSYGWSFYATISGRSGLAGSMYYYYNLTGIPFAIYTGFVALAGILFGLMIIKRLFNPDKSKLTKTLKYLLFFIVLLIVCEVYLQTRFVGKG